MPWHLGSSRRSRQMISYLPLGGGGRSLRYKAGHRLWLRYVNGVAGRDLGQGGAGPFGHDVLPGTFALEHDHYDLLMNAVAVRNVPRYSAPVLRPPESG